MAVHRGDLFDNAFDYLAYSHIGQFQYDIGRSSQPAPNGYWVYAGNMGDIERHHRPVGYGKTVRAFRPDDFIDGCSEPGQGLFCCLRSKHKPVWLAEELLDCPLEIASRCKEGDSVPVVFLQALFDLHRNPG